MRFVKILAIAGFSAACVTSIPEEDTSATYRLDVNRPISEHPGLKLPDKVLMRCEHGCPALLPYVNIMPVIGIDTSDTNDTSDVTAIAVDADVTHPDKCGDVYEFTICCGDGTCQRAESPFFCPQDCL